MSIFVDCSSLYFGYPIDGFSLFIGAV